MRRALLIGSLLLAPVLASRIAQADEPAPGTLTKPPSLVTFVSADYPADERAVGHEANVVLAVDLGVDGHVTSAVVTQSAGAAFDAAALAAVKQFVFSPAEVDGVPAPIRIEYQYEFKLDTQVVAPTTAELTGVIRDRSTGAPLGGVTVTVDSGETVTTTADGRFDFVALAPGAHTLTLSSATITPLRTDETVEAGKRLDVVYDVTLAQAAEADDGDDLEVVVTAPTLAKATASVSVTASAARKVPGTGGDVLRVVESMPGVARASAGSGQLVVWGAAPDDTRVYVDGVRIPRLYHIGGVRSVIAADLVKSIELTPGGWGAAHGRSLGGLVDVGLADVPSAAGATVSLDVIDASASAHASLGDHARGAIALRRSHLSSVLDAVTDKELSTLFPIPRYEDGQAHVVIDTRAHERVELGALLSRDRESRTIDATDPALVRGDAQRISFGRAWARYHRDASSRDAAVDVVGYGGFDSTSQSETFGALPTRLDVDAGVYGLRASWKRTRGRVALEVGLDSELVDARLQRVGALTVPAREGDVRVFGEPPPDQLASDRWSVLTASAAPYASADIALLGEKLHVVPGLRVDPMLVSASRRTPIAGDTPSIGLFEHDISVEPRLAARFDASARVRLSAAVGRYRQPPSAEDLSAVFGSPTLVAPTATHALVGAAVKLPAALSAELTLFATNADDLAVRSPSSSPQLANALEAIGTGQTRGAQILVRRELVDGVMGWVSYTLSRAERTDAPGRDSRLFDYDQTHVLTALASWLVGAGVEVGARVRYATGAPRTPVVGTYYDSRTDLYQPIFGAQNGDRLPAFIQVDVRIAKSFSTRTAGEGEVYLDVQNLTNRHNAEEYVYSADFSSRGVIRGLPLLPVLGARWTW